MTGPKLSGSGLDMGSNLISNISNGSLSQCITVGSQSWCNYVTDGVDDAVQIQAAIDYCAADITRPRCVVLLNQEYNLGDYGIVVKRGVELCGLNTPQIGYTYTFCTVLNITSITYSAVTLHSQSALRRVRFEYPNQDASDVTVYPATITDGVDAINNDSNGILVEDIVGSMPYNFIDFSTAVPDNRIDIIVRHVRGNPLKYGVSIARSVHLTNISDVQFVPGGFGNAYPHGGYVMNYMDDNLRAFYSDLNDGGKFDSCICWCAHEGFVISHGQDLINCMADATLHPLQISSPSTVTVVGGYFVAGTVRWDVEEEVFVTSWPTGLIAIDITGDGTVIQGARVVSSEECIHIHNTAKNTVICGNVCDNASTSGDTTTWRSLISDEGVSSSITGNSVNSQVDLTATNIAAIAAAGTACVYRGNSISVGVFSTALGDYYIASDSSIVEGIARNNGDPNTTGYWHDKRCPGVIIHDYANDKRYIDVNTNSQTPVWKEI